MRRKRKEYRIIQVNHEINGATVDGWVPQYCLGKTWRSIENKALSPGPMLEDQLNSCIHYSLQDAERTLNNLKNIQE